MEGNPFKVGAGTENTVDKRSVKIFLPNGSVKRFRVRGYDDFVDKVQTFCKIDVDDESHKFFWLDEEADWVHFSSEIEWEEALESVTQMIKVQVTDPSLDTPRPWWKREKVDSSEKIIKPPKPKRKEQKRKDVKESSKKYSEKRTEKKPSSSSSKKKSQSSRKRKVDKRYRESEDKRDKREKRRNRNQKEEKRRSRSRERRYKEEKRRNRSRERRLKESKRNRSKEDKYSERDRSKEKKRRTSSGSDRGRSRSQERKQKRTSSEGRKEQEIDDRYQETKEIALKILAKIKRLKKEQILRKKNYEEKESDFRSKLDRIEERLNKERKPGEELSEGTVERMNHAKEKMENALEKLTDKFEPKDSLYSEKIGQLQKRLKLVKVKMKRIKNGEFPSKRKKKERRVYDDELLQGTQVDLEGDEDVVVQDMGGKEESEEKDESDKEEEEEEKEEDAVVYSGPKEEILLKGMDEEEVDELAYVEPPIASVDLQDGESKEDNSIDD